MKTRFERAIVEAYKGLTSIISEAKLTASEINVDSLPLDQVVKILNRYIEKLSEGGGGGDAIIRKTSQPGIYKDVDDNLLNERDIRKWLKNVLTVKNEDNYDYVMGYDTPIANNIKKKSKSSSN